MQNPKIETEIKEVKQAMPLGTPLERGKALKTKLSQPAVTTAVAAVAQKVREVVEFGKHAKLVAKPVAEQKEWEHRSYLRDWFNEKPDVNTLSHSTSHTTNEIYEHAISAMQELYTKRSPANPMFKAHDLVEYYHIMGPAISDVVRNAMKKLQKDGKVKIHTDHVGKNPRYTFELLELPQTPVTQAPQ